MGLPTAGSGAAEAKPAACFWGLGCGTCWLAGLPMAQSGGASWLSRVVLGDGSGPGLCSGSASPACPGLTGQGIWIKGLQVSNAQLQMMHNMISCLLQMAAHALVGVWVFSSRAHLQLHVSAVQGALVWCRLAAQVQGMADL